MQDLLEKLVKEPNEAEWLEFKENNYSAEEIGKRISALSNGACFSNQQYGYLVFGVQDKTHKIVGTKFKPKSTKHKNEDIQHWIINRLTPKIDFKIYAFTYNELPIVIIEIPSAYHQITKYMNSSYFRLNSIIRNLAEFPEIEKNLWKKVSEITFEAEIAKTNLDMNTAIQLLDIQSYFDLMNLPFPSTTEAIMDRLISDRLIKKQHNRYNVTNLGAILFAKNLETFDNLARKAARIITYEGTNKLKTLRSYTNNKGYSIAFKELIEYILNQLPSNEVIEKTLRTTITQYPPIALRELVANALIHQNFNERGTGVIIDIYSDRLEITNPGKPLITTMRFIDEFQSRNEKIASLMRRIGICEEQGSGIDKVISSIEYYQLPAPNFLETEKHTKVTLYAPKTLKEMSKKEKIRACYQHCALKYVCNEKMNNKSLRERLNISQKNTAIASRIIDLTEKKGLIKQEESDNSSLRYASYIPFWA
jgi:ATP-dependent DNA helicase RecG